MVQFLCILTQQLIFAEFTTLFLNLDILFLILKIKVLVDFVVLVFLRYLVAAKHCTSLMMKIGGT